jgi:hypothetical protein
MRRIAIIALTFGCSMLATWAAVSWIAGDRLASAGRRLDTTDIPAALAYSRLPVRPLVAWLGDSTIAPKGPATYPQMIAYAAQGTVEHLVLADAGLDFFHHYLLMGPVLDLRPALVVLIANLRLLDARGRWSRPCGDFAPLLPTRELPRAAALPLYERGLTLPRLLLSRTLRWDAGGRTRDAFLGLRDGFQHMRFWAELGPEDERRSWVQSMHMVQFGGDEALRAYDVPLSPRHAQVRMAAATVAMATRAGIPALVIATPIPWELLAKRGWYDPAVYARRLGVLRDAVEGAGGTFLDLHRELFEGEFRDRSGHFNPQGTMHLARLLAPTIAGRLAPGAAAH